MLIKGHFYMLVDTNSPWYTAIIVRHYSGMIRRLSLKPGAGDAERDGPGQDI